MPSHSVKQARVMSAIAHGWHPTGKAASIPVSVAKEFHAADKGHKYGKGMTHGGRKRKRGGRTEMRHGGAIAASRLDKRARGGRK